METQTKNDLDIYKEYGYEKSKVPFSEGMEISDTTEIVTNPYSEVEVELNPIEVAVYDVLMGCYELHLLAGKDDKMEQAREFYNDFQKGKNWFIENNPDAYFKLID